MAKYTCAKCGETFDLVEDETWSSEKAKAEYAERFPDELESDEPRAVVCDDCYQIMMRQ